MKLTDLAEAVATVRAGEPKTFADSEGFAVANLADWNEYRDATELLARYVVEHAGELVRVLGLEWVDREDDFASHSITVFGRIEGWETDSGWYWRLIADDGRVVFSRHCDSLEDGKAKAEAHYRSRLAAALEPLLPEVRT